MFLVRRITRRIRNEKALNKGFSTPIRVNVTIRRTLGEDVDASCGQLRNRYLDNLKS